MLKESKFVKITISVPVEAGDLMREALGNAGAGKIGNYEYCSGTFKKIGRFKPMAGAHPSIGKVGESEVVEEEVIETICHKDLVEEVLKEIKKVHPYEEPVIDIIPRLEVE